MSERGPKAVPASLLQRSDFATACATGDYAAVLSIVRKYGGIGFTNSHLARRIGVTPSRIAEYLSGTRRSQDIDLIRRICDGLAIPGHMLGLAPRPWEQSTADWARAHGMPVADALEDGRGLLFPDGALIPTAENPDLTRAAHKWIIASPEPLEGIENGGRVDAAILDRLFDVAQQLRITDDHYGGETTFTLVEPEVRFALRLLSVGSFTPEGRAKMLRIVGELTQLAGWAAYDAGWHRTANRYYATALRAASLCGDTMMGVYVMSSLAFQAAGELQIEDALDYTASARAGGAHVLTPGVRSLLDTWDARALSLAGPDQRERFRRSLGSAVQHFERRDAEQDPNWLYWFVHPESMAEIGRGYTRTGDPQQGLSVLARGDDDGVASERDKILYDIYRAEALAGLGEIEEAADRAIRAVHANSRTAAIGQSRAVGYLRDLGQVLSKHTRQPRVRDLHEILKLA
ncbi:hypothetical protein BIV57_11225 [Mangrovactinospora gilvigrisea]|uniref:HTH cro/C1-type domain-containing protein n=1 Tax=Mangrovactinospora gilvigrisea TaxID=1428644 RepID=A0A1J7BFN4_9ACTN|nr:hypothetical protein [Mangrovactinospora gilvigrisea]OIV37381.1 hypothetical protein BIV57_11225 [Mangrovactinospora gilvigrisea]